jgi:hypothetical protein
MDRFYVHSEEFWGCSRKWAVFERLPWPDKWRRASRFYETSGPAERLRDRMNADWGRYLIAMQETGDARRAAG